MRHKKTIKEPFRLPQKQQNISALLYRQYEAEKASLAHEIYDELGQQIVALKMGLSGIRDAIKLHDEHVHKKIGSFLRLTDDMIRSVRQIASGLHPGILRDLGLGTAIEWQTKEFSRQFGIQAVFKPKQEEIRVPHFIGIMIFRIYQELLTNIISHANAKKVIITLEIKRDHLLLTASDNGKGFDVNKAYEKKTFGLLDIKERVSVIGGRCEIMSRAGKGTAVHITVPLSNSDILAGDTM